VAKIKGIPFKDLLFLQDRMSRIFDEAIARYGGLIESSKGAWCPPADVFEAEDAIVLKVELPGVDIKDVNIELKGDVLTINGVRRFTKNLKEEHFHRMEFFYGTFQREFKLPKGVLDKEVDASLNEGVLEIRVPMARKLQPKHVKVEVE
jgi:HSP20 family protein